MANTFFAMQGGDTTVTVPDMDIRVVGTQTLSASQSSSATGYASVNWNISIRNGAGSASGGNAAASASGLSAVPGDSVAINASAITAASVTVTPVQKSRAVRVRPKTVYYLSDGSGVMHEVSKDDWIRYILDIGFYVDENTGELKKQEENAGDIKDE